MTLNNFGIIKVIQAIHHEGDARNKYSQVHRYNNQACHLWQLAGLHSSHQASRTNSIYNPILCREDQLFKSIKKCTHSGVEDLPQQVLIENYHWNVEITGELTGAYFSMRQVNHR